ncbi:isoprenyl transferase [Candidatus Sumerlaeota bacterium]|nr:isoprenyl transferase [Candidatus Sumerlaeota bacterium]
MIRSAKREKAAKQQEADAAAVERREKELERSLKPSLLPRHVAIIMDGNGRWARSRGWSERIRGHEAGTQAVRAAVETCARLKLEALTLYAFSLENWQRPRRETSALMHLLRRFLVAERDELMENNIRLIATGRLDDLPGYARQALDKTREMTAANTGLVLNLALSYSGREEIAHAVRALAQQVAEGRLQPDDIVQESITENLYAPELGDPDLLIRTSGELRVSNFLLWQIAYAEIYITDVLWPDFRKVHLLEAFVDYQKRSRRFGKVDIN